MVMQSAFMQHMMTDMGMKPPSDAGVEMDYVMYYKVITAVQRIMGRLQG